MKRLFDIFFASLMLVLLSPVMLAAGLGVFIFLGRPVFFRQARAGLAGEAFELVKFRTMHSRNDANGKPLADTARLAGFGQFLRATSLDELPELWNVLIGDMSLVGPRPLLLEYLPLYSPEQARRHEVRPGITGWAQVNGRNALSWEQKFAYDVNYVDNHSLALDIKILFRTLFVIIMGRGINWSEDVTMTPFEGRKGTHQLGKDE